MLRAEIDGWELTYLCAGEEVPTDEASAVLGYDVRKESVVFDHPRARRVILDMPMKASVNRYFGVVHWSDGTDLEELDQRARAGDDLSEMLGAGLFCNLQDVQCLECGDNHLVAVADGGNPIVTLGPPARPRVLHDVSDVRQHVVHPPRRALRRRVTPVGRQAGRRPRESSRARSAVRSSSRTALSGTMNGLSRSVLPARWSSA